MELELGNLADHICLPGFVSTTENFKIALKFAKCNTQNKRMVLFAIFVGNLSSFTGFRLNSSSYSAHPQEQEFLLAEGLPVSVLAVEEQLIDVEINNSSNANFEMQYDDDVDEMPSSPDTDKQIITVIYLYTD